MFVSMSVSSRNALRASKTHRDTAKTMSSPHTKDLHVKKAGAKRVVVQTFGSYMDIRRAIYIKIDCKRTQKPAELSFVDSPEHTVE